MGSHARGHRAHVLASPAELTPNPSVEATTTGKPLGPSARTSGNNRGHHWRTKE